MKNRKEEKRITTTNYRMDSHKKFCSRCYEFNGKICPLTGKKYKKSTCNI